MYSELTLGGIMAIKTMKEIKASAKKRRAKYLNELIYRDCTITILAEKYKMTTVRMGQLIKQAREDIA